MPSRLRRFKCWLGIHRGNVHPAHELDEPIAGRSAFVCSYCGTVLDGTGRGFLLVDEVLRLWRRLT